jgi:subtilisin family serine protease
MNKTLYVLKYSIPIIIVLLLLPTQIIAFSTSPTSINSKNEIGLKNFHEEKQSKKFYELTLITGDIIEVAVINNTKFEIIGIKPADPKKLNKGYRTWEDENGLYVLPSDVDIRKVDIELFNVKYLIKEGYYNLTQLPIMVITEEPKVIAQNDIEKTIKEQKYGVIGAKYKILPAISSKLDLKKIKEAFSSIISKKYVKKILLDKKVRINLDESVPLIGADNVWEIGYNGSGIRIAIIDTGIDNSHPDFYFPNGTSKIEKNIDFTDDHTHDDLYGHGTHCAGIAAGTGAASITKPFVSDIQSIIKRLYSDEFARIATNGTHLAMVWHSYYTNNWEIWFSMYDGYYWTNPEQLTNNISIDKYPFVTFLKDGRILVLWYSNRTGDAQIWYKVYDKGTWSPDKQLTIGPNWHVYSPVTQLSNGSIAITYTSNASSNEDVWFAILNLDSSNTLNWVGNKKITNANSTMSLYSSSIIQVPDGKVWVFTYDIYNFNFTTNIGGITQIYYNVSSNGGTTWSGDLLTSGSGFVNPSATVLSDGTMMLVFEGDDLDRNIPFTLWYMVYYNNTWTQPEILTPNEYLAVPSIVYMKNKFYITAQNWMGDEPGNDIFLLTIPIFRGVAPGAKIWNVKVLNRYGWGYWSWIISGIEYATYGPDGTENTGDEADVLSLSLGEYWWTDGTDPVSMACDNAVDLGRIVVVAAGNQEGYFHIGVPATARKVITVGATDKYDNIAGFSSYGPTIDYRIKPDILAPGVDIISTRAKNGWFGPIPENSYYTMLSGTSMSTPFVAGAAALLKQYMLTKFTGGRWSPEGVRHVKDALISHAKDLEYNVYQQGSGRLDIYKIIGISSICVHPATISFGLYTENKIDSIVLEVSARRAISTRNLTLWVSVEDIINGGTIDCASLNVTTLQIPPGEVKHVLLTINTTVPASIYSGKLFIKDIDENYEIHAIFGFARLNKLEITFLDLNGNPLANAFVRAFKADEPLTLVEYELGFLWNYTDNNGKANLYVLDGIHYVIGSDYGKDVYMDAYAINKSYIDHNMNIILDLRNAYKISYSPLVSNQIIAWFSNRISYGYYNETHGYYSYEFGDSWYYPKTTDVYITSTDLLFSTYYQHYDKSYLNIPDPSVLLAPELYSICFYQKGINQSKVINFDKSQLAKVDKDYRVALTPSISAWIERDAYVSLFPYYAWLPGLMWEITSPKRIIEWLSPSIDAYIGYDVWYEKHSDQPNVNTPYFVFSGWEYYPSPGNYYVATNSHPLSSNIDIGVRSHGSGNIAGFSIWTDVFQDSRPPYFYDTLLSDNGRLVVKRNGTIIIDTEEFYDYYGMEIDNLQLPARFEVELYGRSNLYLSTNMYTKIQFDVPINGDYHIWDPFSIIIEDLDLNNTANERYFRVHYWLRNITNTLSSSLEYSVDDGVTWRQAIISGPFRVSSTLQEYYADFSIRDGGCYVSLRISSQGENYQNISSTIIKAFYVDKLGSPIVSILNFDDGANRMGSLIPSVPSTVLYFPHFHQDSNWRTYIALVNPNSQLTEATLIAYSNTGSILGVKKVTIGPRSKISDFVDRLIPGAKGTGWVKVSSKLPIIGLLNFDDYSNRMGSLSAVIPATTIYFPHFHDSGSWRSYLSIVNPNSDTPATINIMAYDNDGNILASKNYNINPLSKLAGFVSTIIGKPSIGSLKITADIPVVAILNFDDKLYRMGSLEPSVPSKVLLYPHVHQDFSWRTYIAIMNTETELRAKVRITLYDNNGNVKGMIERSIPPNGRIAATIQQLFPGFTGAGHIIVESNVPIAGMLNFDDYSNRMGSLPATTFESERIIAHFHQGGGWRSYLAIVNYGDKGRTISINYLDKNGNILNSQLIYLNPENKRGAFTIQGVGWISIDVAQND